MTKQWFHIMRTSDRYGKPCPEAIQLPYLYSVAACKHEFKHFLKEQERERRIATWHDEGINHREDDDWLYKDEVRHGWFIEIDPADIMNLVAKYGMTILKKCHIADGMKAVGHPDVVELSGKIEIYDDYRE